MATQDQPKQKLFGELMEEFEKKKLFGDFSIPSFDYLGESCNHGGNFGWQENDNQISQWSNQGLNHPYTQQEPSQRFGDFYGAHEVKNPTFVELIFQKLEDIQMEYRATKLSNEKALEDQNRRLEVLEASIRRMESKLEHNFENLNQLQEERLGAHSQRFDVVDTSLEDLELQLMCLCQALQPRLQEVVINDTQRIVHCGAVTISGDAQVSSTNEDERLCDWDDQALIGDAMENVRTHLGGLQVDVVTTCMDEACGATLLNLENPTSTTLIQRVDCLRSNDELEHTRSVLKEDWQFVPSPMEHDCMLREFQANECRANTLDSCCSFESVLNIPNEMNELNVPVQMDNDVECSNSMGSQGHLEVPSEERKDNCNFCDVACIPQMKACFNVLNLKNPISRIEQGVGKSRTKRKNKGVKQVWLPSGVCDLMRILRLKELHLEGKNVKPFMPRWKRRRKRLPTFGAYD